MIKPFSACSDVGSSARITKENNTTLPTTMSWIVVRTSVTTGVCVACGAGAVAFFSGGRLAYLLLAMPVMVNLAMAVCWLIVWGLVELTVHCSVRRLCRLAVDLHSQHKIAREAVRWVQELEVTLKALSMAPAEPQQTTAGAAAAASGGAGSDRREDPAFCERPHESVAGNSPACSVSYPCERSQQECFNLLPDGPRGKHLPAGALRVRLCQVLGWQEDILSRVYEDVMRPKAGAQVTCRSFISRRPWTSRDSASVSSRRFDGSLRALRDIIARSWVVHSKLWAGFQIVLMQLLLSLDTRLQRGQTVALRRRNGQVGEARLQLAAASSGEPAQRPSRALRQALITLQQQNPAKGNKLSLGEEVAEATVPTSGESVEASTATCISGTLSPTNCVSFSLSRRHGYRRVQETGPSAASASQHRGVSQEMWALGLCKAALRGVFAVFDILKAAADGIAAAWWVLQQLNRLEQAIFTAAQVAEAAASTLRAVLEEDWALCSVPLPQPRWVPGMLKNAPGQNKNGGIETEPFHLMPCTFSPPSAAFRPFSRLLGAAAPARRTALASMSRHIGASLAILRLSAPSCRCDAKQTVRSSSCGTHKRTSCLCCLNGVTGGSGDGEAGHQWKSAATEEKENTEDAELSSALHLTLGHLRTAIEEAERLQHALRLPGEAVETVQVSRANDVSADAPVKAKGDEPFEQIQQVPQQSLAEPLQYLEVYTAIGQNSSSNRSKCQEEAALLAAFADEDTAMRQRSHFTLRELKVRLQSRELKRQNVPCILKDFPAGIQEATAVAGGDEGRSKQTVRFFPDSQSSGRLLAEYVSNAGRPFDGPEASPTPEEGPCGSREGEASVFASEIGDGENAGSAGVNEGVAFTSSQAAGGVFEFETNNMPVDSSSDDRDRQLLIDSESLAFRLRQQKLRGGSNEKVWRSSEDMASRSFMSQLQGVLTEQRRKSGGGQGLCRYSMAAANTTTRVEQLGLDIGAHYGDPTAFGDDISSEKEWDSRDVVEGPNYDAEAPVWVAVAHASEGSQPGTTDSVQQGGTDHRQDPG